MELTCLYYGFVVLSKFFRIYEMTGTFMTFEDKKNYLILKVVISVAFPETWCCLRGVSGMLFLTSFFFNIWCYLCVIYVYLSVWMCSGSPGALDSQLELHVALNCLTWLLRTELGS